MDDDLKSEDSKVQHNRKKSTLFHRLSVDIIRDEDNLKNICSRRKKNTGQKSIPFFCLQELYKAVGAAIKLTFVHNLHNLQVSERACRGQRMHVCGA